MNQLLSSLKENLTFVLVCILVIVGLFIAAKLFERSFKDSVKKVSISKYAAYIAMFSALSGVLMTIEIPLFFAPSFYKIDLSEIPVLICTFYLGPVAGVASELLKVIIKLMIKGTSTAFSWLFTYSGISKSMVNAVVAMNLNPMLFSLVIALVLLVFGTFLEGIAIAVLLVPVLWPVASSMGIDIIHFGMIVCISNVIGTMTPPVAVNIFSARSVSKLSIGEIAKGQTPFFIGYLLVFLLVVFIPALSKFLL